MKDNNNNLHLAVCVLREGGDKTVHRGQQFPQLQPDLSQVSTLEH